MLLSMLCFKVEYGGVRGKVDKVDTARDMTINICGFLEVFFGLMHIMFVWH